MTKKELTKAIKEALNPTVGDNPTEKQLAALSDTIASNLAKAIVEYVKNPEG